MKKYLSLAVCCALAIVAVPALAAERAPISFDAGSARVHSGTLTPASQAAPADLVKTFLTPRHAERTFDTLKQTSEFFSETANVTHLRMAQEIDGLEVHGTYVKAAVNEFGELVWLAENLVTPPAQGLVRAQISPRQALGVALDSVHPFLGNGLIGVGKNGNTTVFDGGSAFFRPPTVTRVAVPMRDGSVIEGFRVETWTDEDNLLHHTLVSGTGELLNVELRTAWDSYNIFPDHPGNSTQTIVLGAGTGNLESPLGWLDPVTHSSVFITGNNVRAYLDTDANNSPDAGGVSISDGNFLTVASLSQEPETAQNQEVAVQNLFYFCNAIHDQLYKHGFVESAGNFQVDNFGNGGSGNDPVLCEAQDGSGTNNANFSTPSDGSPGRMQMFVWTQTSPKRDGDLDSDIIWHEYGHGLTWRMIGSMSGAMSGAIGEGNSDVLSLLANGNDVVGEYSTNDPFGIRSERYEGYSRTYGDFDGGSVHFDGEIYAAIHWDLGKRYAAAGFTTEDHWADMVGGMNFTPSAPAYEDMRDGMLAQAPAERDCLIWESFAQFGVGVNANGSTSGGGPFGGGSVSITEDFTVPSTCGGGGDPGCTATENPEVSCSDGQDNDCDGDVDANDTDCQGSCTLGQPGDSCRNGSDCCSGQCTSGRPATRVCL